MKEEMLQMLKDLMWYSDPDEGIICVWCKGTREERIWGPAKENHAADCELVSLIQRAEED